jgi:putative peptide modification system cyclase
MMPQIANWLESLGLGEYTQLFAENRIDASVLPDLTDQDLEKIGMVLGHRKKVLRAIAELDGALRTTPLAVTGPNRQAERRQLTVMFCDLVGSTPLSARLDPEDMRAVIDAYNATCVGIIPTFDGFCAEFRGDGILAYFGYPRAHEDDAERAVRAALDIIAAVGQIKTPAAEPLAVRIGIATGLVVVGGEGFLREHVVVGDTPNLAARLQALAEPGTVVIASSTQRLLGDLFHLRNLGRHELKGIADPVAVYEVGESVVAPMRPPPTSGKARHTTPSWRRPASLAVGGIALLVASGFALYFWIRSDLPLSLDERDWVVLGDVVNVNADPALDAPLAAAFRIGLEESRFVNVVPAVAMRNALARMQRNDATRIDRDTAAEIALREQARGVIVPSIAQYGANLRVAVELIAPNGVQTVWTQSADAAGTDELLGATDRLLRTVRSRLGESLPRIEASSHPLEKATTASMEALRALSQAIRLEGVGDTAQAEQLLSYAVGIDPNFAAAYARLGAISFAQQRYAEARSAMQKALAIDDRLSERERVFVAGVLSYYSDPPAMLSAWGLFSNLYPQWANGPHNIGNVLYERLHDYANAEKAYRSAASLYNPYRNYTLHSLGHVLLAQEKSDEAEKQFRAAIKIAPAAMLFGLADTLAATGRYEEAEQYLNEAPPQDASAEVERSLRRMTLLIARGQFDAATKALSELSPLPSAADRWRVMFAAMALRLAANDEATARDTVSQVIGETSAPAHADANLTATEHLLYGAYWAARLGLNDQATDAVALAQRRGALDRFPVRAGLAALVRAQVALNAGYPDAARLALERVPHARALWEAHELRADIAKALSDRPGEAAELQWLVAHRGLAHAQWIDQFVGQQLRSLALRKAMVRLSEQQRTTGAPRR